MQVSVDAAIALPIVLSALVGIGQNLSVNAIGGDLWQA
jgi:hypothetical protein